MMPSQPPLVTILLVTYNQQNFVGEALRGALDQVYNPLEILIADDCSTDDTVAIAEQIIAQYEGLHDVRIMLAAKNLGLLGNLQRGIADARGELIVIGAGDDVPMPHRVSAMVAEWQRTGAAGLHSRYDAIDDQGNLIESGCVARAPGHVLWSYLADKRDRSFVGGATSAYDADFLRTFPLTTDRIFHEDAMFTLAIHALGRKIAEVPEATVRYRVHAASYSNRRYDVASASGIAAQERDLVRYARDSYAYLKYLRHDWLSAVDDADGNVRARLDISVIDEALRRMKRQSKWIDTTFIQRLVLLITSNAGAEVRFALPRLFGLSSFAQLRAFTRRANDALRRRRTVD